MTVDRDALEALGRHDLIEEARRWGVRRPEVMTRVELVDEVIRVGTPNPVERKKARGWLGVARDLIASVVDRGLNLPDAAALIRGEVRYESITPPRAPVATVTLAEIYGAQGHLERAINTLDQVLATEPDHGVAHQLRERMTRNRSERAPRRAREDAEVEEETDESEEPTDTLDGAPPAEVEDEDSSRATNIPVLPDEPDPVTLPPEPEPLTPRVPSIPVRDSAVVFVRTETGATLYYELGSRLPEDGAVVLRVVEMLPQPGGAKRTEKDIDVVSESGVAKVLHVEQSSVIRAALGIRRSSGFRALAVAAELCPTPTGLEVVWTPRRGFDYGPVAARATPFGLSGD